VPITVYLTTIIRVWRLLDHMFARCMEGCSIFIKLETQREPHRSYRRSSFNGLSDRSRFALDASWPMGAALTSSQGIRRYDERPS
jgi:hypothetical protein